MSNNLIFYIFGLIIGFLVGVSIYWMLDSKSIKSPIKITPTIEIHINPDGTNDTTYFYTK